MIRIKGLTLCQLEGLLLGDFLEACYGFNITFTALKPFSPS